MERSDGEQGGRHSHHHHHREPGRVALFLRQYRFELIWGALVLLGVFLLVERMDIRRSVVAWLRSAFVSLGRTVVFVDHFAQEALLTMTLSDALGLALILLALGALLWRIRWRLLHTPSLALPRCPLCKGSAHRVHRTAADRLIDRFVPVHRYRCANPDCPWEGLRINDGTHHREHRHHRPSVQA